MTYEGDGGFGIYVHWPFCEAKCPYCDFNSHVVSHVDQDRWARAMVSELRRYAQGTEGRVLGSIYFGGGTPSVTTLRWRQPPTLPVLTNLPPVGRKK